MDRGPRDGAGVCGPDGERVRVRPPTNPTSTGTSTRVRFTRAKVRVHTPDRACGGCKRTLLDTIVYDWTRLDATRDE